MAAVAVDVSVETAVRGIRRRCAVWIGGTSTICLVA